MIYLSPPLPRSLPANLDRGHVHVAAAVSSLLVYTVYGSGGVAAMIITIISTAMIISNTYGHIQKKDRSNCFLLGKTRAWRN
jgi:hypothetical protein